MEINLQPKVVAEQEQIRFRTSYEESLFVAESLEFDINAASMMGHSEEEITNLAERAVEQLNVYWAYHDEIFYVAGRWIVPKIIALYDSEDDIMLADPVGVRWEFIEEDVCSARYSQGWGYKRLDNKVHLGLTFAADSFAIAQPYLHIGGSPTGFALPEKISLELVSTPNEEQTDRHGELVCETLEMYDKLIRLYTSQESFRRQPHHKQAKTIDRLIQNMNDLISLPGTGMYIDSDATELYTRAETSTGYGFQHIDIKSYGSKENIPIQGMILGVTILERDLLSEKAIRSDNDFIDKDAGLCMLIEAYNDGKATNVCIPYRAIDITPETLKVYNGVPVGNEN